MMYDYYLSFLILVKSEGACEVVEKKNRIKKRVEEWKHKKKMYKRLEYEKG